jgi:AsmA-like protein
MAETPKTPAPRRAASRSKRVLLTVVGSVVGLVVLVYLAAWLLLPKDWVEAEAMRMASKSQGATVRWKRLTPGLQGLSFGVKIEGMTVRMPAEGQGDPSLDGRIGEVFVRFKLLPLLLRRVEVDAARVHGAGIAMFERAKPPGEGGPKHERPAFSLQLPRLDFDRINLRSRDRFGSGYDVRGFAGHVDIQGSLEALRSARVEATGDSLFWKPSAQARFVRLPGPLHATATLEPRDRGARYEFTQGHIELGALTSELSGSFGKPPADGGAIPLALVVTGKPQELKSSDEAFRSLAPSSPAAWSTKASWTIRIGGTSEAMVQKGEANLQPLAIEAGPNRFSLDRVQATYATTADQKFTLEATGNGSGVSMATAASGSTAPGGGSHGTLHVSAPATRLNGLMPNTPVWTLGTLDVGAIFTLEPPAAPVVRWTITGKDLSGSVTGLQRPVTGLQFHIDGDQQTANVRSMTARVGSSAIALTGSVRQGKPLGTGTFRASMDRFVAEEWANPRAQEEKGKGKDAKTPPPAPPAIPLRAFDGMVTIGEVHSGNLTIRNLSTPIQFAADKLVAAPIQGDIGTGTITGKVEVKDVSRAPSYAVHFEMKRVPVREFVAGMLPLSLGLTGFANGQADIAGAGLPGLAAMNSITGALQGNVEEGKILETPTIGALRQALGSVNGPGSLDDLVFKSLRYSARIEKGRLVLHQVDGALGKDLMALAGSAGFDHTLDLDLLLRLAPGRVTASSALGRFANYARDEQGRLPIRVAITGTVTSPKISLKAESTMEAAGKGLAKDLFQRIMNGGNRPDTTRADTARAAARPESARADTSAHAARKAPAHADSTAPDPIRKAQEALEKIFKK